MKTRGEMMDKLFWSIVTAAAICMNVIAEEPLEGAPVASVDRDRPNIIFVMTDDQGWGDTGYNGHPELKTPNLDAMAEAGIRFDRFYSAATMCSPTRASCLTGRSPVRYRCMNWGHDLPLREVTIAEAARTAGYATGHFGKWHLGGMPDNPDTHAAMGNQSGRGLPASFDSKPRNPGNQGFDEWFSNANYFDIGDKHLYHNGKKVPPRDGDTSDLITDLALEWMRKQVAKEKPFLALVWFPSPHGPHHALPEDAAPYAKYGDEKAQYYGEIAGVDRNIGLLRETLRKMKIADNTILWFCSDNGGFYFRPLTTGGLPGYKGQLTEGGTRVPGILEWPARVQEPFITSVPASTMDFYPTVLDLLDIKLPNQIEPIDGISLLPLIDGKMDRRPKPIPLVSTSGQVRVIDNEYTWQGGKLFRFAEGGRKDINITDKEPKVHKRLTDWATEWQKSVKKDQAFYTVKRP